MPYDFRDNRTNYEKEKEVREKRLSAYSEDIQKRTWRTLQEFCLRIWRGWRVEKEFRHWLFYRNMPPPWENISS